MDKTREYLETRLRARYGMDEMLMKRDRLSKALADVEPRMPIGPT